MVKWRVVGQWHCIAAAVRKFSHSSGTTLPLRWENFRTAVGELCYCNGNAVLLQRQNFATLTTQFSGRSSSTAVPRWGAWNRRGTAVEPLYRPPLLIDNLHFIITIFISGSTVPPKMAILRGVKNKKLFLSERKYDFRWNRGTVEPSLSVCKCSEHHLPLSWLPCKTSLLPVGRDALTS